MPYSTFCGLLGAIARAKRIDQRSMFMLLRQAQYADKESAEKLVKGLSDE